MSEPDPRPAPERRVFRVGELLSGLRNLLADRVGLVWVAGEVSNLHRAASGHCYFTLKDERGQLRAALFRGAARSVPFELEEGMEVIAFAEVTIYAERGDLQLIVRQLEPLGQGALQLAFEQLRRRLEAEGLFDPGRKRRLPEHPRRIGLVTSPTGAAIRDVLKVAHRRYAGASWLIAPTRVQGDGAEREIVAALERVACEDEVDVVLLVRGGGSLEDLQAFNSERVANAIALCPVPIVCGVGHEVDITIADLVADVRAPTPSAAAVQVLPDRRSLEQMLRGEWRRLVAAMATVLERAGTRLEREGGALRMLAPLARLELQRARLSSAARALVGAQRAILERRRARLAELASLLDSLSPLAVLARGYALVRLPDGRVARTTDHVAVGDRVSIRLAQASLEAVVESIADLDEH